MKQSIPAPPAPPGPVLFPVLQRLSASSLQLSDWSDIDSLDGYKELRALRLSHIPLFAGKGASEVCVWTHSHRL